MRGELFYTVRREIHGFQRRLFASLISLMIIAAGVVFLLGSLTFFLIEYLAFSKTITFLLIGIVLLFIGIIIKVIK